MISQQSCIVIVVVINAFTVGSNIWICVCPMTLINTSTRVHASETESGHFTIAPPNCSLLEPFGFSQWPQAVALSVRPGKHMPSGIGGHSALLTKHGHEYTCNQHVYLMFHIVFVLLFVI